MNKHLMQTGRTTRLVERAKALANDHFDVVILMPTREMATRLQRAWQIPVPVEAVPDDFDWERMRDPQHPHRICLVDHIAVEMHLAEIDKEVMRLQQLARQLYPLTTN